MASKPIYQMYAELQDYEPKIWRRFQVMNDITVARLAYILMTLFEMQGSHLYKFEVNELDNFILNHLEHYNKYMKEYDISAGSLFLSDGDAPEGDVLIPKLYENQAIIENLIWYSVKIVNIFHLFKISCCLVNFSELVICQPSN